MEISILGSCNIDYIFHVDEFPKPGQTIKSNDFKISLGGKGFNNMCCLTNFGFKLNFLGKLGDDQNGENFIKYFEENNIDHEGVLRTKTNTGIATIYVNSKGENMIVLNGGSNFDFNKGEEIPEIYKKKIDNSDLVIIINEFNVDMIEKVINYSKSKGKKIFFETGGNNYDIPMSFLKNWDFITSNCEEATYILKSKHNHKSFEYFEELKSFLEYNKLNTIFFLKLDEKGCVFISKNKIIHQECINKILPELDFDLKIINTIGAGDAYNGAIIYKFLNFNNFDSNSDIIRNLNFANFIAYIQIQNENSYLDKNLKYIKNIIKKYSIEDFL